MTDKTAQSTSRVIRVKRSELPVLEDSTEAVAATRLHDAGNNRGPAVKSQSACDAADKPDSGQPLPALCDKYDLSLVDDEREMRRQARRR